MLSKLNFSSVSRRSESKSDRSISQHGVTLICNHIITFIDYFVIEHMKTHNPHSYMYICMYVGCERDSLPSALGLLNSCDF